MSVEYSERKPPKLCEHCSAIENHDERAAWMQRVVERSMEPLRTQMKGLQADVDGWKQIAESRRSQFEHAETRVIVLRELIFHLFERRDS